MLFQSGIRPAKWCAKKAQQWGVKIHKGVFLLDQKEQEEQETSTPE